MVPPLTLFVEAQDLQDLAITEPAFPALDKLAYTAPGHLRLHSFLFSQLTSWQHALVFAGCVDSLPYPAAHTSGPDARSVGECRGSHTNSYLFPAFFRAWHSGSLEAENKW